MPHTRHLHNSWLNSVGWIHNFVWTLNLDKMVPTEDCTKMYSSSLKRSRSPELKLAQLRKASGHDDVLTDNLRSQKRYLSQVTYWCLLDRLPGFTKLSLPVAASPCSQSLLQCSWHCG